MLGFRLDKFTIGVVYQGRRSGRRGSRRPRKRRREVVKETWNILKFEICYLQFVIYAICNLTIVMMVMIVTRIDFEICNLQFYKYIKNRGALHTA